MASKFSQVGTQTQTLTQNLTPQQLLVSNLTEMPIEALYERVDEELKENVSLERDDQGDEWDKNMDAYDGSNAEGGNNDYDQTADYSSADDIPDNLPSARGQMPEEIVGETMSFYDQLEEQIGFFHLSSHEEELIRYLIGSLDDDGLLRTSLQQIQDELEVYHNVETSQEELEHILHTLQNFEPAGVGARTLQECLLLQVQHAPDRQSPIKQKLELLLSEYFDFLMQNRWDRIQHNMQLTESEVSRLQHEVRRLNPRPGNSMGESIGHNLQQITPDFIVETDPYGQLTMTLNKGRVPTLHVSDDDLSFLRSYEGRDLKDLARSEREGISYLRDRVERAQGFIDALQQRQMTLTTTMQAIMKMQHAFFETGDDTLLRPMTLEDVAKQTGLHLSTISRVSNSNWVQTTYGVYPLLWFFTSGARLSGDTVSIRSIKTTLKEIIDEEDKQQPLTDEALTTALQERGFDVARRTVTKYRVAMGIPIARMRK